MNISNHIEKKLFEVFEEFKDSSMSDIELIGRLREESGGSSFLFYFLIEKLLSVVFSNNYIILSKGILKDYLKSNVKEEEDYIYIGGTASDNDKEIIKTAHGIVIKKGLFIKIIEKLELNKTLNNYIKFLLIHEEEVNEKQYLSKEEIEKYKDINLIIEVMYNEFDKKIGSDKKFIEF